MERIVCQICLWLIRLVCRTKDEDLANIIHKTASLYQRRPDEGWMP